MTTIAYREGVLAGDTLVSIEPNGKVSDTQRKVRKLRDGRLYGFAGSVEEGHRLFISLRKGEQIPKLRDLTALLIDTDGTVWLYEGNILVKQTDTYYSIGTGGLCALCAMDAGESAVNAVRIAIKRDVYSGGKVLSVKLKDKTC